MPRNQEEKERNLAVRAAARQQVFDSLGGRCVMCGSTENVTVHEIRPRSIAPATWFLDPDNMVTLCHGCHHKVQFHRTRGDGQPYGKLLLAQKKRLLQILEDSKHETGN